MNWQESIFNLRKMEAETAARVADNRHKAEVKQAAIDQLYVLGIPISSSKKVISLIARDAIPGVSINY